MINARSESVLEKPAFRKAVQSRALRGPGRRLLRMETGRGPARQAALLRPPPGRLGHCFRRTVRVVEGPVQVPPGEPAQWMLSMSIMTADSAAGGAPKATVFAELTALHDRVPLPMSRDTMSAWLDPRGRRPRAGGSGAVRGEGRCRRLEGWIPWARRWATSATTPRSSSNPWRHCSKAAIRRSEPAVKNGDLAAVVHCPGGVETQSPSGSRPDRRSIRCSRPTAGSLARPRRPRRQTLPEPLRGPPAQRCRRCG